MTHKPKDFRHLLGHLEGMSVKQLEAHFGLYRHYVEKLEEIEQRLAKIPREGADYSFSEYSELKRREAVAFNGAYLHEAYFANLGPDGSTAGKPFRAAVTRSFGSWDSWIADLKAAGASTPGWVLTTRNLVDGRLHNYVLHEHHLGLPVHQHLVLALDCWEHAYMIDYGTSKSEYLAAFVANIDWKEVDRRFETEGV